MYLSLIFLLIIVFRILFLVLSACQASLKIMAYVQGGSGVGFGNFQEVGPLTVDLKPRLSTWLNVGHLLFVVMFGLSF